MRKWGRRHRERWKCRTLRRWPPLAEARNAARVAATPARPGPCCCLPAARRGPRSLPPRRVKHSQGGQGLGSLHHAPPQNAEDGVLERGVRAEEAFDGPSDIYVARGPQSSLPRFGLRADPALDRFLCKVSRRCSPRLSWKAAPASDLADDSALHHIRAGCARVSSASAARDRPVRSRPTWFRHCAAASRRRRNKACHHLLHPFIAKAIFSVVGTMVGGFPSLVVVVLRMVP